MKNELDNQREFIGSNELLAMLPGLLERHAEAAGPLQPRTMAEWGIFLLQQSSLEVA